MKTDIRTGCFVIWLLKNGHLLNFVANCGVLMARALELWTQYPVPGCNGGQCLDRGPWQGSVRVASLDTEGLARQGSPEMVLQD